MALPLPPGLTPPEIAFLCEMELVTVIPRQRLESLELISGPTPPLRPPARTPLPLWLALLLHRQRRANILPPPWLSSGSLAAILEAEIQDADLLSPAPPWPSQASSPRDGAIVSPPFLHSSTGDADEGRLPYHWLEMGEILLSACSDDIPNSALVRGLLRDLREVRQSKLRAGMKALRGGGVLNLRGVGAMEIAGERGFVVGVMGGLRALGASKERERRDREAEGDEDEDDDMDVEL
ncbi:MAG: DNA replication protein psf2 [Claussenomyces sp. TS43310]|nr:MAG: DNA replication protein psf2 [Claussenomyces sp. TS43310]